MRGVATVAAVAALLAVPAVAEADDVLIQRTEHGTPHIVADDDRSLGFGYGYAVAEDNVCLLAEAYVTVAGERSRWFGPDGQFVFHANGARHDNVDSDLFYRQLNIEGAMARLRRAPPPVGPRPEVQELVRGYVAGYNRYLADVGVDAIPDPACRGQAWVRPITEDLAYARFAQLASLAGGGLAITGIARAQPPGGGSFSSGDRTDLVAELGRRLDLGGLGSNAIALGSEATRSGAGMVLGNPHLPWEGDYRLYEAHLTIPGELDVTGATFIGVPLVLIGHTRRLAWSHTTSSAFRFTPFELDLVPGDPTSYLVDGQPRAMTSREVTVDVRREDGSMDTVARRLWSTEYGPVLTELLGLPLFPWTPSSAYAFADANAENLRYLNHFYEVDRAQSVPELDRILRRNLGIPWANTVAADAAGRTLYADATVVPHVTDEHAERCNTALGAVGFAQLRLPVLDGSRSDCRWGTDPDAVVPGIFGPRNLPFLERRDYVTNSNDSHWLANPAQPLEGFARIIGDERTERSMRTRLGLRMVAEGLPDRFTLGGLTELQMNDRNGAAELTRDELVGLCRSLPVLPSSTGPPVEKGEACDVLEAWDGRDALGSRGTLLFRRWSERALPPPVPGANAVGGGPPAAGTWSDRFDPDRPVETPNRLDVANPKVQASLGDAVRDLRSAGIPLDAPLGDWQYEMRGSERIPMHGGPGRIGVFNALNVAWRPGEGYPDIPHGNTFMLAVELSGRCPPARTLVAYSQSASAESPWFADQTRMYSRGEWARERWCRRDVLRSPALRAQRVGCLPARAGGRGSIAWLRPGLRAAAARRRLGAPTRRRRSLARWCVAGGGSVRIASARRRVALVATTARSHRIAGARPGARLRRARWRRAGGALRVRRRAGGRRRAVVAVRAGRVRWVGLVGSRAAVSPRRLQALARRAGLRSR